MDNLKDEDWVDVIGFPNYMVSSKGRVLSKNFSRGKNRRLLSSKPNMYGYKNVHLWNREADNKKPKPFRVCRLVALHFVPNPHNKEYVNHKNGNRQDDSVENLEWVTNRENQTHGFKILHNKKKLTGAYFKTWKHAHVTKWYGAIRVKGRLIHLGYRDTEQEAHELYLQALKDFGLTNCYV